MILTALTEKVTGPSNAFFWGGCFAENGLFIVMEIKGDENNPAPITGKKILDSLLTKFTNLSEINHQNVVGLLEEEKDNPLVNTCILAVLASDRLYLRCIGQGEVRMEREGKSGLILSGNQQTSGILHDQDRLLISSATFLMHLGKEKIIELLKTKNLKSAAELAVSFISSEQNIQGATAIILTVWANQEIARSFPTETIKNKILGRIQTKIKNSANAISNRLKISPLQDTQEFRTKKTLLTIAVILTLLLFFSIFFNISHGNDSKRKQQLGQVLDLVSHQYDEAISLMDLNPLRARSLLSDSKMSLSPLLDEFPKNTDEYKQVNEWLGKIAEKEVVAYKIYKLTSPPLFFDLSFIKADAVGDMVADYQENKAILDFHNKTIYALATDKKQSSIVAGAQVVKEGQTIGIHGSNIYLLNSDGVVRIDIDSKTAKTVVKPDQDWGQIVSLVSFGGNIYLLDSTKNAVWKYIATDFGFSARSNYLNPDVKANFSQAKQMVIDGSVWVLSKNGSIQKFSKGLGEPYSYKGFSENLTEITAISTSETDNYLYILDAASGRIVVFDKDGAYMSQYQWDELKKASGIVASEPEKKIFVLIGSKIYAIDIK